MTAVEWLFDKLKSHFEHDGDLFESVVMAYSIAKQMEKEQIEISDEEIGKQSWVYDPRNKFDVAFIREGFIRGAQWYREQLKNNI